MNTPTDPIANPYVGPRTFTQAQRHLFFGREREARDLLARVLSERLVLFYAQSGAGKSSLINTRLIPQLREVGYATLPVARVGGELPAGVTTDNVYLLNLMLSLDGSGRDAGRLAGCTLSRFLAGLSSDDGEHYTYEAMSAEPGDGPQAAQPYVLIVDQFEELITSHPGRWRERDEFFRQLNQAMLDDPNLWVLLALREDYVAPLEPYAPLLADRMRARFYMERMGVPAALEAIRRPAELGGRPFAPGVAEQLVDNLRLVRVPGQEATIPGQYVEPVQLQVVCYQLWENLGKGTEGTGGTEGTEITLDDLAEAGDVNRALTQFYEETLAVALTDPAAAEVSERQLRTWFDDELITDAGTRGLVRQGEQTTGSLPNAIIARLQGRFLVRGETRSGDTWIELVHDRFIEPIRQSNRAWFGRNLNPLTVAAQAWQDAGKAPTKLYTGSQLEDAARQLQAHADEFGDLEREFVKTGQEIERRAAARRQRIFTALAAALLLLLTALTTWALTNATRAGQSEQQAVTAAAQAYAARADSLTSEAVAIIRQAEAEAASTRAVASAGTASVERAIALTANVVASDALAAQEANLVAALTAQAVIPPAATPSRPPSSTPIAIKPTSTPTRSGARTILPPSLPTATPTMTPALKPTLNLTVAAQETQLIQVRSTQTQIARSPIQIGLLQPSAATPARRVTFPPAGRIVFTSNRDNPVSDLYVMRGDGKDLRRLTFNMAFEPSYTPADGGRIAFSARRGQRVSIYTIAADGSQERNLTGFDSDNWEPAFSRDGRRIAFVSSRNNLDWEIYVMNADGGDIVQFTNDDPTKNTEPAWSPYDWRIAFVSSEPSGRSEIHVMDRNGANRQRLTANNAISEYPAWSPDGRQIAFASNRDGNMDIFVIDADGRNQRNLTRSPFDENFPAWSPDGQWIAFSRFTTNNEIFVMTADGDQVTNLTQSDASDWAPIWLP